MRPRSPAGDVSGSAGPRRRGKLQADAPEALHPRILRGPGQGSRLIRRLVRIAVARFCLLSLLVAVGSGGSGGVPARAGYLAEIIGGRT